MTSPERASSTPTAGDQLRRIKDQVVGQTKQTIREARDRAGSSLAERKGQLAEQVGSLANAFRKSAERLREDDRATVAGRTDSAGRASGASGTPGTFQPPTALVIDDESSVRWTVVSLEPFVDGDPRGADNRVGGPRHARDDAGLVAVLEPESPALLSGSKRPSPLPEASWKLWH
jgi:hypothetical protein